MSLTAEKRAGIVDALADHVLRKGLQETSLRQLAKAAGTSDRMLLYYFRDKNDLLGEVLGRIAVQMQIRMDAAIKGGGRTYPAATLARKLADLTRGPELRPYMVVSLEIAAAAARGTEPYRQLSGAIVEGFVAWTEARLRPEDQDQARFILTLIDGIMVLDAVGQATTASAGLKNALGRFGTR